MKNNPVDAAEMEDLARDAMCEDLFPRLSVEDVDDYARLLGKDEPEGYSVERFYPIA